MAISVNNLIGRCQRYTNDISTRVDTSDWQDFITTSIREVRRGRTFPWQKKETTIELFTDVFVYQLPDDFDSIIKPRQSLFTSFDSDPYEIYSTENEFFTNINTDFALAWVNGIQYLLSRKEGREDVIMDGFEDPAANYTLAGDANTPVSDNTYFREGAASLRFNITASAGTATITRTISQGLDLTDFLNKGKAFLWVYMPTVVASVTLNWGANNSNYYTAIVTASAIGTSFKIGWNLLKFDMNGATVVGTPTTTNIPYYQIVLANGAVTDTDFRVDGLYFRLPTVYDFPYNSKNIITDITGVVSKEYSDNTDDIILGDVTFEEFLMWLVINKAARYKLKDADLIKMTDTDTPIGEVARAIKDFNRRYPSQESPIQINYYKRFRSF